jgi:lipoprotein NlpD
VAETGRAPPEFYEVRTGDTLFAIAARFGLDHRDLARWNRLGDGSLIFPGQRLRLRGPGAGPGDAAPTQPDAGSPPPAWRWPADATVASRFGESPRTASGILLAGPAGAPVVAAAPGEVVYAGSGLAGYGLLAIVRHDATWLSAYGHNTELSVREGERVAAGQAIGRMGPAAGHAGALHFEIRRNGEPVDPLAWLPRR